MQTVLYAVEGSTAQRGVLWLMQDFLRYLNAKLQWERMN